MDPLRKPNSVPGKRTLITDEGEEVPAPLPPKKARYTDTNDQQWLSDGKGDWTSIYRVHTGIKDQYGSDVRDRV